MCTNLFEDKEIFDKYIYEYISKLVNDKVVNVRISLAELISKIIKKKSFFILNKKSPGLRIMLSLIRLLID